jgi:MFS family permease
MSTIFVLLPILAQTFGFTYAEVGLMKGLKSLSQAAIEVVSGWLSEQIGEYRLVVVGLIFSGLGYLLLAFAPSVLVVTICLAIIGAGTALHHAPSSAMIANNIPANSRSGALGVYNASGDVGKLVFTGLVSLATGFGFAWHQISFSYGLIAIAVAVVIFIASRSLQRDDVHSKKNNNDQSGITRWGILNWRSYGALLAVTSIDTLVQTATLVFVSFLMLAKGLPLSIATGATVLLLAGGIFGKAGCGYLAQRMGVRPTFALIQGVTAVGLFVIVIAPNWLALALLVPLGAALQGTSSITYGFAADLIDPRRMARGYALLYSVGTFASAVGPFVTGIVADGLGIEIAMYCVAAIALLAVPPIFILPKATHQGLKTAK